MQNENSSSNSKFRSSGAELFWAPLIVPMFVFQHYEHIGRNYKIFFQFPRDKLYIVSIKTLLRYCKNYIFTCQIQVFETKFSKYFTKKIREYILKDIV